MVIPFGIILPNIRWIPSLVCEPRTFQVRILGDDVDVLFNFGIADIDIFQFESQIVSDVIDKYFENPDDFLNSIDSYRSDLSSKLGYDPIHIESKLNEG